MDEFIKNMTEIGVNVKDAEVGKDLANELSKVHQATYTTDCLVDFIKDEKRSGLKFNFETESYNIFLDNLAEKVSTVELSLINLCSKSVILTRKEKLLSLAFHEIRHRAQKEGLVSLFTPDSKMPNRELERILFSISCLRGNLFWDNMIIYEKEEFDAQFITAAAQRAYQLKYNLLSIADILLWSSK